MVQVVKEEAKHDEHGKHTTTFHGEIVLTVGIP